MTAVQARIFATAAHAAVGQKRKYTGEDYITHPIGVVSTLMKHVPDLTDEMIAAAYLHDVLEDTQVTAAVIMDIFGPEITEYVVGLTDISVPSDGNRAARKAIDLAHLSRGSAEVHTIKCADIIHNTSNIVEFGKGFAVVYLYEVKELLRVLNKADKSIHAAASDLVDSMLLYIGS